MALLALDPVVLTPSGPTDGGSPTVVSLPRLRPLWSGPGLAQVSSPNARTVVRGGTVLAWAYDTPTALVGLDLRTGHQRWRMPMPNEYAPTVVLAGDVALLGRSIGVTAIDLATGQQRWTRRLCGFQADLHVVADARIAIGMCRAPDPPPIQTGGARLIWTKNMAVAIDLRTGREQWRLPTGWPSDAIAAVGNALYLATDTNELRQKSVTVSVIDPPSGKTLRSFPLPSVPRRIQVFPADPTRALFVGEDIVAVRLVDGHLLWQRATSPRPAPPYQAIPRPDLDGGRLFVHRADEVLELDLQSGGELSAFRMPPDAPPSGRQTVVAAPAGGLLVITDREQDLARALSFAKPTATPTVAVLPARYENLLAVEAGVAIVRQSGGIEAFSIFDTVASEEKGLDVPARVRAVLARHGPHFDWPFARTDQQKAALAELRSVSGYEATLGAIASDVTSPLHAASVDAVALTRIPGASSILLAEVLRPLQFPTLPKVGTGDHSRERGYDGNAVLRREALVTALADLDDPKVADALTPLLFDAESPTGLGRRDWEIWGPWVESGYGKKRWAHSPHGQESAFSDCLQTPAGRPEAHAAIYRLLARLGRPRDLAALRRFDADNGVAAGWSRVCDRDDATTEPYSDRTGRSFGLGLCAGWDAGRYRLSQAEALWLRRRLPNGALGPPAWALDPGGGGDLDRRTPTEVRLVPGDRIEVAALARMHQKMESWSSTLEPPVVFADRDHDGLTDLTEAAFGTDPDKADTDGDGVPDGRDPAPLARPSVTDAARVHDEVVRFWTTFRSGGPVTVYADRGSWGGGGGTANAGIVLHRPLAPIDATCSPFEFCQGADRADTKGPRQCEALLAIEGIAVHGDEAEATASWPSQNQRNHRIEHKLRLRRVDGAWRVTGDRGPVF
ncbi:MAG TPA: PQQ-binding-like beta-propeller repeat protein [Polyangia bacterium]